VSELQRLLGDSDEIGKAFLKDDERRDELRCQIARLDEGIRLAGTLPRPLRPLVQVVVDALRAHDGGVEIRKLLNELNKDDGSYPYSGSGYAIERDRLELCIRCNGDRLSQNGSEVRLA
jgi:hypothetical protein